MLAGHPDACLFLHGFIVCDFGDPEKTLSSTKDLLSSVCEWRCGGHSWLEMQIMKETLTGLVFPWINSHWGWQRKATSEGAFADLWNCFPQTLEHPKKAELSARMSQKEQQTCEFDAT